MNNDKNEVEGRQHSKEKIIDLETWHSIFPNDYYGRLYEAMQQLEAEEKIERNVDNGNVKRPVELDREM